MNSIRPIINDRATNNSSNNQDDTTTQASTKGANMTIPTFQPTSEQWQTIQELQSTTIAGNHQSLPKTDSQMIHQLLEYGIRAIQQQRKQYQRQRAALRSYKG